MTAPAGRLHDRVALITGASRGIGRAVARRFAEEGAHLILVARTVGGLEEVDDEIKALGASATLVPLDLTDLPAIDRLGAALFDRFGRLDVLVGNAGMLGSLGPLAHTKPEAWDKVLAVNLTANWRLIRSMDALLRASDAGRAIFVTDRAGSAPRAYWGTYAIAKAALETMAGIYAAEVEGTKVRVNLLDPGTTRTAMRAQAFPGEDPQSLKPPEAVADIFVELALPACTRNGDIVRAG